MMPKRTDLASLRKRREALEEEAKLKSEIKVEKAKIRGIKYGGVYSAAKNVGRGAKMVVKGGSTFFKAVNEASKQPTGLKSTKKGKKFIQTKGIRDLLGDDFL